MIDVRMTSMVFAAVLFIWLAGAGMATGEGTGSLYEWKDDKGNVNVVDDVSKVPDKYRSKAKKLGSSGSGNPIQQQQTQEPAASEESVDKAMQDEDIRKAEWQQRMHDAKRRLSDADDRYSQIELRKNELGSKFGASGAVLPTQEMLDEMNRLEGELARAKTEKDKARNEVEVNIPDEARRAGIPPGWLRDVQ